MRYKKVLLIAPRFYKGKYRLAIHPLAGLGYIAESLKSAGISVEILDMNLKYSLHDLQRKVNEFMPDIIGFTVMTFGYRDIYETINRIKRLYPEIKVAVGGPHISMLREQVLADCQEIDYGIILEGDYSFVELCKGEELDKIQGLIYHSDGQVVTNDFNNFIMDLDNLSFPRYESFELDKYPTRQIGVVTSRGCPYDCIYCPVISAIGKQFRQRSAPSIVDEIEYWYKKGYREILVLDDNFTLSRKRTEEICELLAKKDFKGISLKCPNGIRADRIDYGLLKAMREVGFNMIAFGVEAAEDRILKNIRKGEDIATIERGIGDACKLGYDVDLFFMIGSPGERLQDVKSSFSLAMRYPVKSAEFYNIIPFPTTDLFKWIDENGYFLYSPNDIMNNASHFINKPCFYTPEMSADDRKKAFKIGQNVSRRIRRRFIERRISAPLLLPRLFSWIYTLHLVDRMLISNGIFIRLKEKLKRLYLHKI